MLRPSFKPFLYFSQSFSLIVIFVQSYARNHWMASRNAGLRRTYVAMAEVTHDKKREMPLTSEEAALKQEIRKKRKLDKTQAMKTGVWDRCMFKVVRKNRFCSNNRCVVRSPASMTRKLVLISWWCLCMQHCR